MPVPVVPGFIQDLTGKIADLFGLRRDSSLSGGAYGVGFSSARAADTGVSGASDLYNQITGDFQAQMDANRIAQAEQAQIDRDFQLNSAREAMDFSAAEAAKQRNWQEMMSNTAYQRAVQDMRAAGINPILAYTQGGASTPSGAAGTGYAASGSRAEVDTNSLTSLLGSMMTSAASVARGFLGSVGSVGSTLVKVLLGV